MPESLPPSSIQPLPAEDGLIDQKILSALFQDMPMETANCLTEAIAMDIEKFAYAIVQAEAEEDLQGFKRAIHGLAGLSSTFGAKALLSSIEKANSLSRAKNAALAFSLAEPIRKLCFKTSTILQSFTEPQTVQE